MRDRVDTYLDQWARERPELDASPMGVLGRLSRASRALDAELRAFFAARDLQPGEFDILATLRRAGAPYRLTAGALATSSMVTSGAITNRIDRLVTKGLVTREVDPSNRRSVLVTLTEAGRALVDEVVVDHVANERRLLEPLSAREQEQLAHLLRKLLSGLGDTAPGDTGTGGAAAGDTDTADSRG